MNRTISITPKWQIHIPVEFREVLGLEKPGLAEIKLVKKAIVVEPKKSSILKLAGKYRRRKPTKKLNLEKIREKIDYSQL